jgi:hypothetical protein
MFQKNIVNYVQQNYDKLQEVMVESNKQEKIKKKTEKKEKKKPVVSKKANTKIDINSHTISYNSNGSIMLSLD